MSGYTYPPAAPSISGDVISIHRLLQTPPLVSRRFGTLAQNRYISDALLPQRLVAKGGAIAYETGEEIGTAENPRAVAAGAEYPLVQLSAGTASMAKTTNWGQDVEITDVAIARMLRSPVDRGMTKLVNQSVSFVDSVSMSAIGSAVTNSAAMTATIANATAEQILLDVAKAKASVIALDLGFMPGAVVLDDIRFATTMAKFIAAGYLPREAVNGPIVSGDFPDLLGMTWMATNHGIASTLLLADTEQLGGMADEDLGSPGYTKVAGVGVETKVIRDDDLEKYKLRARRVTVPVILEPSAGYKLTSA